MTESRSKLVRKTGDVVTCPECGAMYKLRCTKVTMRDRDRLLCDICKQTIHEWSEAKVWEAKRIDSEEQNQ